MDKHTAKSLKARSWYIEAREGNQFLSGGTGVVVWLYETDRRQQSEATRFPSQGKPCLLTCAHVLRKSVNERPVGQPIEEKFIRVWPANKGFLPTQSQSVKILRERPVAANLTPKQVEDRIEDDWTLLELEGIPGYIDSWFSDREGDDLTIFGYSGGSKFFGRGTVRPRSARGFRIESFTDEYIELQGNEETRPGMSGGGIFHTDGSLVGLHRSYFHQDNTFRAVPAAIILKTLAKLEFRVDQNETEVPKRIVIPDAGDKGREEPDHTSPRWLLIAALLSMLLFLGIIWWNWPPDTDHQFSVPSATTPAEVPRDLVIDADALFEIGNLFVAQTKLEHDLETPAVLVLSKIDGAALMATAYVMDIQGNVLHRATGPSAPSTQPIRIQLRNAPGGSDIRVLIGFENRSSNPIDPVKLIQSITISLEES